LESKKNIHFRLVIYNFAQDEFVDDPQMASHLAKIGVKTLERASHELQIWQKAEAPNENVRVSLSDTVRALSKYSQMAKTDKEYHFSTRQRQNRNQKHRNEQFSVDQRNSTSCKMPRNANLFKFDKTYFQSI